MTLNFMSPFIQVFGTLIMLIIFILKIFMKIEVGALSILGIVQVTGLYVCGMTYLANILINIFLVKYNKRKIKNLFSGILMYSFFIITWIPINVISIFSKDAKWEKIEHTRSVKIGDIVND